MHASNTIMRSPSYLELIYPDWVRNDNSKLVNLITKHTIELSEGYKQMLDTVLTTNFLSNPPTEYEILTRIWALELIEYSFLIFQCGLIDGEKYSLLKYKHVRS